MKGVSSRCSGLNRSACREFFLNRRQHFVQTSLQQFFVNRPQSRDFDRALRGVDSHRFDAGSGLQKCSQRLSPFRCIGAF